MSLPERQMPPIPRMLISYLRKQKEKTDGKSYHLHINDIEIGDVLLAKSKKYPALGNLCTTYQEKLYVVLSKDHNSIVVTTSFSNNDNLKVMFKADHGWDKQLNFYKKNQS